MHIDPIMPVLVASVLATLVIGLILKRLNLPSVVAYLLVGVVLGPHGLAVLTDPKTLTHLGSLGALLLLFFVGMEISLPNLFSNWRVAVFGTLSQIFLTVLIVWLLGYWFSWPLALRVLLGFVISLSSTAVVIKLLQDNREVSSEVGNDVLGILLVQDLAIIPMLVIIGLLGGKTTHTTEVVLQLVGGAAIVLLLVWVAIRKEIVLPLGKLREDHEMQVFAALVLCFGLSLITGLLGLSSVLGAFVAGILVSASRHTSWVHDSLGPFRVVFVALFFVSIGMLVDLRFLAENWAKIVLLVLVVLVSNTLLNATILKLLQRNSRQSLYGGALLSQIGEFSFVLAAVGVETRIVLGQDYQLILTLISLSLMLSPIWILLIRWLALPHRGRSPVLDSAPSP